jgi:galactokinase
MLWVDVPTTAPPRLWLEEEECKKSARRVQEEYKKSTRRVQEECKKSARRVQEEYKKSARRVQEEYKKSARKVQEEYTSVPNHEQTPSTHHLPLVSPNMNAISGHSGFQHGVVVGDFVPPTTQHPRHRTLREPSSTHATTTHATVFLPLSPRGAPCSELPQHLGGTREHKRAQESTREHKRAQESTREHKRAQRAIEVYECIGRCKA